jgi:hypothetical protein
VAAGAPPRIEGVQRAHTGTGAGAGAGAETEAEGAVDIRVKVREVWDGVPWKPTWQQVR